MKRNVFGATIVAGGLALFTSVSGFAGLTPDTAKHAVSDCATAAVLTDATGLTPEAATEAAAIKAEAKAARMQGDREPEGGVRRGDCRTEG
jgi:hypothetical protein